MSTPIDDIWNAPAEPAAVTDSDGGGDTAVEVTATQANEPAVEPSAPAAESQESPSSDVQAEKATPEASPVGEPAAINPEDDESEIDTSKIQTTPEIRSYLNRANKAIKLRKELAPLKDAADRLGGQPVLQETLDLREKFDAEDVEGFFNALDGWSPSTSTEIKAAMIRAALELPEWRQIAIEKELGKPIAEIKALLAREPAEVEDDAPDPDYDEKGNYITPDQRRIQELEAKLAEQEKGKEQEQKLTEAQKAQQEAAQHMADVERETTSFMDAAWAPVEAKLSFLKPSDTDSDDLKDFKAEQYRLIEEDSAKEIFEGAFKPFTGRTMDLMGRGEFEAARKRLDAAKAAAEKVAEPLIARATKRIADYIEVQRLKSNPTTRSGAPTTDGAAAPGNFAGAPKDSYPHETIDDIWAVDPARTRDVLADARARGR